MALGAFTESTTTPHQALRLLLLAISTPDVGSVHFRTRTYEVTQVILTRPYAAQSNLDLH